MNQESPSLLLHERFRHRARSCPDAVALEIGTREVTYAELSASVDRIAAGLEAASVEPGSRVGLHVERSVEWVAAQLAILGAGAAVVPLPPSYPRRHLEETIEFGRLHCVVEGADEPIAPPQGIPAVTLDELTSHGADPGSRSGGIDPDQPAFVLSSSGSTGHPKLIVRSHRSFFHRLQWTWDRHPYAEGEACCQKAHMTTTHAIYELFEPLLAGTRCVLIPDSMVRDLEGFWTHLRDRGVSRLLAVPSMLRASFDLLDIQPPDLSVVVLMGEPVDGTLARMAVERFRGAAVYSIYGSTEASSVLVSDLREPSGGGSGPASAAPPLGVPIASTIEALVLDPSMKPVPRGEAGRLYIGGPALFSGYLGLPDLTGQVLLTPPGRSEPLYDTRDRVHVRDDGSLEYVGRVDHIVKIRGYRVDLGAVEEALLAHPAVVLAAAAALGSTDGQSTLHGFVTPADLDLASLRTHLEAVLPDSMRPSSLVAVDQLPTTPSGKVDRSRLADLRSPESERLDPLGAVDGDEDIDREGGVMSGASDLEGGVMGGASDLERTVAEAWAAVLGHGRFGLDSGFFEVGGTSLNVFSLLRELRARLERTKAELDVGTIYRVPSIAGLTEHLRADETAGDSPIPGAQVPGATGVVARLRAGDGTLPPLFLVASAGGTLGPYQKLTPAIAAPNPVVGLRDPFLWGQRDPSEGFDRWIDIYLEAVLAEQERGPYCICAYSSAGAFGFELARRLEEQGVTVGLLALVDPLALACRTNRFAGDVFSATWAPRRRRALVRLDGWWRRLARRSGSDGLGNDPVDRSADDLDVRALMDAEREASNLIGLAALIALDTGSPPSLAEEDFDGVDPSERLEVFVRKVGADLRDVDPSMLRRLAIQYGVQVHTQHHYRLAPLAARVLLVEPRTRYAGLLPLLLNSYATALRSEVVDVGPPSESVRRIVSRFAPLDTHFRCMRDDDFVTGLGALLTRELARVGALD